MAFAVKMELHGLKETLAVLRDIKRTARNKILRPAINAAGQLVLKSARQKVTRDTGMLKKSLAKKVKTYKSGAVIAIVGPKTETRGEVYRQSARWGKGGTMKAWPAVTAHLVERGTKPHQIGVYQHPGSQAQPFLEPALEENRSAIEALMIQKIREGLDKYKAKQAAKE